MEGRLIAAFRGLPPQQQLMKVELMELAARVYGKPQLDDKYFTSLTKSTCKGNTQKQKGLNHYG